MKIAVLQKEFSKTLNHTTRFVAQRAQLPILSNIKIETNKARLVVSATNLEMSIAASIGAKVEEDGEIAVPARVFSELVSSLSSEKLEISTKGEVVSLSGENFKGTVSGINTADFPEIPSSAKVQSTISSDSFVSAVTQIIFSVSLELARPALAGVLLIFDENKLSMVSSDGFRLSRKTIQIKNEDKALHGAKIIVPKAVLSEVVRLVSSEKEIGFSFDEKERQVLFSLPDSGIVIASRLVEGEYPPFEKIIPQNSATTVSVDKKDLFGAVKTASIFARDGANTATLHIEDDALVVSAESARAGKQETSMPAKVTGPGIDMLFNYRYLEEFLSAIKGDSILMKFNSATSAGVFLDASDENYLHLIMPVKS